MVIGLGIDIVELNRIAAAYARYGNKFCARILTPRELAQAPSTMIPFLAARFAAKEAAVKALGTGFSQGITFQDVEIANDSVGKPSLCFFNQALKHYAALQAVRALLSISHGRDTAVAVVILEQ
ncbi:MAG: holo-[acyl-carrier-protein] synthase [Desulfomicrobium sp.]|jgi:holo-[acyl-carrier protein] synthase|nr:holo-[acyl-carrier-protein] synthase [Desulfomicrobium sp.]